MSGRRVLIPKNISPRPPAFGGVVHALDGVSMGTTWAVCWVGPRQPALAAIEAAIAATLAEVVAHMSHWQADSDLGRFNHAPAGTWRVLPQGFWQVLAHGLALARDSEGAFDPCAGALVDLWGFGAERRFDQPGFRPPDDAAVERALGCSGWQRLALQPEARRVRQPGGLRLDLSAIAKGHAVDRIAECLAARFGIDSMLVEVGGELAGRGVKPDGQPWWVALQAPDGAALPQTLVALHGLAIATSGDYLQAYAHQGRRHAHTIDPRSGRPIVHGLASVTVLAPSGMAADALATALTVLGPQVGPNWAEARGIAALFVTRRADGGFDERMTPAFAALAT